MKINRKEFFNLLSESVREVCYKHNLINEYAFDSNENDVVQIPFKEQLDEFELTDNGNLPQDGESHTPEQIAIRMVLAGKESLENGSRPSPVITNVDKWWWGDYGQENRPSLQYGKISFKFGDEIETINVNGRLYDLDNLISRAIKDVERAPLDDMPHTDEEIFNHLSLCVDSGIGSFTTDTEYWFLGKNTDTKPVIPTDLSNVIVSLYVYDDTHEVYVGTLSLNLEYRSFNDLHDLRMRGQKMLENGLENYQNEEDEDSIKLEYRGEVYATFTKDEISSLKPREGLKKMSDFNGDKLISAIKFIKELGNGGINSLRNKFKETIKSEEQKKEVYKEYADILNYITFATKEKYGNKSNEYDRVKILINNIKNIISVNLKRLDINNNE